MKKHITFGVLLAATAAAAPLSAHHSFAVFFNTDVQMVKVTGVVQDFQLRNPHGTITLLVPHAGVNVVWKAETNSPSLLRRRGWTPDALHVGDKVTLEGWPARDGSHYMRLRSAIGPDGKPVGQPVG